MASKRQTGPAGRNPPRLRLGRRLCLRTALPRPPQAPLFTHLQTVQNLYILTTNPFRGIREEIRVAERKIGIVMNGVTGRMGMHQHLVRSILAIRNQGGIKLPGGEVAIPDPILVGRNETKLRSIASAHGVHRYTTDLNRALDSKT